MQNSAQLDNSMCRAVLQASPSGVGVVRPEADGTHTLVEGNAALAELFGSVVGDLIGRTLQELLVNKGEHLAPGEGWTEHLCRIPSGATRWTRWFLGPLDGSDLLFVQVDLIHERVMARLAAQRQSRLLDQIPEPVIVRGLDGEILYWNTGAAEAYGFSAIEALGRRTHDLLQTLFHDITLDKLEHTLAAEGVWSGQLEHTTADGRILQMASKHVRDDYGDGRPVILEINVDMSDRLLAEQKLAASEAKFRGQFQNSTVGQMMRRLDGIIEDVNPAFATMLGYDVPELIGSHVDRLFTHTVSSERRDIVAALARGDIDTISGETMLVRADGSLLDAELNVSLARWPDGTIQHLVSTIQDITARKVAEQALTYRASHDGLTGAANRELLNTRIEEALLEARSKPNTVGLLYLDLDGFKAVNDRLGHHAGDELLVEVAHRLEQCVRGGDTIARIGGDEFAVLCPDLDGPGRLRSVAGRVLAKLSAPYELDSGLVDTVTASVGISYPRPDDSPGHALREADRAMYLAKRSGKNRIGHFGPSETGTPATGDRRRSA